MPAAVNVISMTPAQQSEKKILHSFYTSDRKMPVSVYLTFLVAKVEIVALTKMRYASISGFSKGTYSIATFSQWTLKIWTSI